MKQFVAWKCDMCDAIFEFDADVLPLRCPDCFSTHEHLCRVDKDLSENKVEQDDE